ncbi:DUF3208 domain-containing protein [Deinococcus yavapaiensis]|uniref:Uncharacterized protein DUF3208 n=1 Tax=Deinococcus yavapaiensis KR-236 TaxID=694435 RepID=A0A318SAR9_9DEIO|nr:DUF3208 domain-containing protein [Deinococcus yavapaiensis]PYE56469.1 uncharacterized protein DUF3208 [Deinococcus yavapaiensis KR-236]
MTSPDSADSRVAVKLLQGYLWHPKDAPYTPADFLPSVLEDTNVLFDEITPPFAFFDDGTLTSTQAFYQFTALRLYDAKPDDATLHEHALRFSQALGPVLQETPRSLGWELWEDLREL